MKKLTTFLFLTLLFLAAFIGILQTISPEGARHEIAKVLGHKEDDRPLLYVFHAPWCGKCPSDEAIEKLQARHPNVKVENVDIDQQPDLKAKYHAQRVPLFVFETKTGSRTTRNFNEAESWLREH